MSTPEWKGSFIEHPTRTKEFIASPPGRSLAPVLRASLVTGAVQEKERVRLVVDHGEVRLEDVRPDHPIDRGVTVALQRRVHLGHVVLPDHQPLEPAAPDLQELEPAAPIAARTILPSLLWRPV